LAGISGISQVLMAHTHTHTPAGYVPMRPHTAPLNPVVTRTFVINSVIVVAISYILNAIYMNNNESSCGNSDCNGAILLKIHNFHWSNTSTEDANTVAIGK
jgi:hypothetical protein